METINEKITKVFSYISETLVSESKLIITKEQALNNIREYLDILNLDEYDENFGAGLQLDIYKKNQEIVVLKKALEMACAWINNSSWQVVDGTEEDWERARNFDLYNHYLEKAREEIEDGQK